MFFGALREIIENENVGKKIEILSNIQPYIHNVMRAAFDENFKICLNEDLKNIELKDYNPDMFDNLILKIQIFFFNEDLKLLEDVYKFYAKHLSKDELELFWKIIDQELDLNIDQEHLKNIFKDLNFKKALISKKSTKVKKIYIKNQ